MCDKILVKMCNGSSKRGICAFMLSVGELTTSILYKRFEEEYLKLKFPELHLKEEICIILENYLINEDILSELRKSMIRWDIEKWVEFDVFLIDEWYDDVSLKGKEKSMNLKIGEKRKLKQNKTILNEYESKAKKRKIDK